MDNTNILAGPLSPVGPLSPPAATHVHDPRFDVAKQQIEGAAGAVSGALHSAQQATSPFGSGTPGEALVTAMGAMPVKVGAMPRLPRFDRTTVGTGQPIPKGSVVIDVDPKALIRAHQATDPGYAQYDKVASVGKFAESNALSAPEVGSVEGRIGFTNGRNRAKLAADSGLPSMPIVVEKENAADVLAVLTQYALGH